MNHIETMTDEDIWRAVAAERQTMADLLADRTESDWNHQSLCADWRVRDVVAHVVLCTRANLGWILINLIRAGGSVHGALRDTAIRHADSVSTRQLHAELRASVPSRFFPVGTVPTDRLLDMLVHVQDIAMPLGLTREMPSIPARESLNRVWATGSRFGIEERLTGYRLVATDIDWSAGDGLRVEGTAGVLLMLATGRTVAAAQLTGPGAGTLAATLIAGAA
ncbi:maleylpyruvate isomerase family mycothiol-dependent enzyme [Nocardia colli]|uniref:Maleylpyruvate isomerase family mycothiol-dependent enzyme n=1 Tax=Nocardia colli TaxID=2545717 RepID=A0A5N0E1V1_9NOCA|nr:maleylpyruvate isomerase family mycothiol-dependent enzyme [Nocardia colli]KAA8882104.1 maleylpyruvate isomerase family mycothiol-dependent enzyme [Nocardia colli]